MELIILVFVIAIILTIKDIPYGISFTVSLITVLIAHFSI